MKTKTKKTHLPILTKTGSLLGALNLLAFTSGASGAITLFGSDNEGFGGFTSDVSTIAATPAPAWSIEATGVRLTNGPTTDSGQVNSSLLKAYTLNRTSGTSCKIAGVLDIASTYAADNNRFGISLFANTIDLAGIDSGLSLQYNLGNGAFRILRGGVNGSILNSASTTYNGLNGASAIGTTFTYQANVAFVGTDIDIDFTLIDQANFSQSLAVTVPAADFTGEYFGFGTRGRVRGTSPGVNDAPFIYDAKSFDVALIPEPSAPLLLCCGLFGWSQLRRRSRPAQPARTNQKIS